MSRHLATSNLSAQELAFLAALLELGGPQHAAEAAWRAGYGNTYEQAESAARVLVESPKLARALRDAAAHQLNLAAAVAQRTLVDICANGKSESARISAAQEILNRSLGPIPSRSMTLTAKVGVEDLLAKLDARERGADAIDVTPAVRGDTDP